MLLPKQVTKVLVPPIKCQGIKTKLIPFIAKNICWQGVGKWVEPFLGSGSVAFNIAPENALLCDSNKHIINFYKSLQDYTLNSKIVREQLEFMGNELTKSGIDYYYEVRKKFNESGNSLDFIFLNRSCFNGLMRFNSKGGFNVPFGHKNNRFSKAYITKICNQIDKAQSVIIKNNWVFKVQDWKETLSNINQSDFVYLDPPYIGRNTDYYNGWSEEEAIELSRISRGLPCQYALSMWLENKYRKNDHIAIDWLPKEIKTTSHFYHIGSTESLRNSVVEALVLG